MHTLTFFPLGNADCTRINLASGKQMLIDYADMRNRNDVTDKRIDLPARLLADLAGRGYYDVAAFTHLDNDHVAGSSDFFYWEHAACYQSPERIKVNELWVPAAAILDSDAKDCARVVREEAKHRLRKGHGIRVFSRPGLLKGWLEAQNLTLESRQHLICDAGSVLWDKSIDGVEFFVHSPFASRLDACNVIDRNADSLVLHATFSVDGVDTKVFLGADIMHEGLEESIRITRFYGREERLENDIVKLPHHCSYKSLGPDKGDDRTEPTENIAYMYEQKLSQTAILVSTSWPVPDDDEDDQPPHRQAKKYYKDQVRVGGEFIVTMEHPSRRSPEPLVIEITGKRGRVRRAVLSSVAAASSTPAPRAG